MQLAHKFTEYIQMNSSVVYSLYSYRRDATFADLLA